MSPLGSYILETLLTLFAICVLAVGVLYAGRRAGVGRSAGPLELVGRLPLEGRRAVYLVRIGRTVLVLGGSEAGLNKLGELSSDGLSFPVQVASSSSFRQALARVVKSEPQAGASNDETP
jgi:flagellar biogenesis protein FliO